MFTTVMSRSRWATFRPSCPKIFSLIYDTRWNGLSGCIASNHFTYAGFCCVYNPLWVFSTPLANYFLPTRIITHIGFIAIVDIFGGYIFQQFANIFNVFSKDLFIGNHTCSFYVSYKSNCKIGMPI